MKGGEILEAEATNKAELLTPYNVRNLLDPVDAFLFDCDGVIWKGDVLIDGVPNTLDMLRSMGKRLVFVTNNSTKSRRQYAKKFQSLGIDVSEEEIFSSSFAAAMFLKVNDFPKEKKVYVIGEQGILDELELAGFTGLGGPEDGKKTVHLKSNCLFEHDKNVEFNIHTSRMCMVGDRLDTDILFGKNAGCRTLLVLSGVTSLSTLQDSSNDIQPDYYTSTMSDIHQLCKE